MSSIAALPGARTAPVRAPRPRLELVRPGFVPAPARPAASPHVPARPRAVAPTGAVAPSRALAPVGAASDVGARAQVRTRPRLTARGRAAVATLAFLLAATGAVGVGAWAGQAGAAGAAGADVPVATVTVASGETLWGIAAGVAAPGEDVRDVVDAVLALNGLASAELRPGQQILVPAR